METEAQVRSQILIIWTGSAETHISDMAAHKVWSRAETRPPGTAINACRRAMPGNPYARPAMLGVRDDDRCSLMSLAARAIACHRHNVY